jgi:hypothetical protein
MPTAASSIRDSNGSNMIDSFLNGIDAALRAAAKRAAMLIHCAL